MNRDVSRRRLGRPGKFQRCAISSTTPNEANCLNDCSVIEACRSIP